jgi:dihydrolipoamide dehydrogenase
VDIQHGRGEPLENNDHFSGVEWILSFYNPERYFVQRNGARITFLVSYLLKGNRMIIFSEYFSFNLYKEWIKGEYMKEYDVVIIGSGSGAIIASRALAHNQSVALIDKGPLGGTCLNVGCIPSKILIYPADMVAELQEAKKLGISAKITHIDFQSIMERMRRVVKEGQEEMRGGIESTQELDFYETEAFFTDDYTLDVGGTSIKGEKLFIVSGARPLIPPIEGIEQVDYLTNETVLQLTECPESLLIIGGGYIAAEYGHFFAAMGSRVTIMQRGARLVSNEEPEISDVLKKKMGSRMDIHLNTEVVEVQSQGDHYVVVGAEKSSGEKKTVTAQKIMVAAGRKSNADILKVENTGVDTDKRGYITVNKYLETSKENIWAFGDATGMQMFRHVANREADIVWNNSQGEKMAMDYSSTPHAVFSHPQIASVGMTEEEAQKDHHILVGRAHYSDVAKGMAMMEEDGFAKAIVDKDDWTILGFHIIGPYAPILIQEVINVMATGGSLHPIGEGMHIHPALPEVVVTALSRLQEP